MRKSARAHKPVISTIISLNHLHHETEFFIFPQAVQDGATSTLSDENVMNINFAMACMIVVSFAIALSHI
ncbi:hypothetical protein ACN1C3_08575 [Pseudomonas sp. H11T01]|uniref:hypothetical protein n=1 Tax=Pseudomonas sp. H11T01 TaxID=3402749 RepID=UPI003AC3EAEC